MLRKQLQTLAAVVNKFGKSSGKNLNRIFSLDKNKSIASLKAVQKEVLTLLATIAKLDKAAKKSFQGLVKPGGVPREATQALTREMAKTYDTAITKATQQAEKTSRQAAKNLAKRNALNVGRALTQFRSESRNVLAAGGDTSGIVMAERAANRELQTLYQQRLETVKGNGTEVRRLRKQTADVEQAITIERNKAMARLEADRRTNLGDHLQKIRDVGTRAEADTKRKNALRLQSLNIFNRKERRAARDRLKNLKDVDSARERVADEALKGIREQERRYLRERELFYNREFAAAKGNIDRQRRLQKQWLEEQKSIRFAFGGQFMNTKQELARTSERRGARSRGDGLNQHQFAMFQGLRDMVGRNGGIMKGLSGLIGRFALVGGVLAGVGAAFRSLRREGLAFERAMSQIETQLGDVERRQLDGLRGEVKSIGIEANLTADQVAMLVRQFRDAFTDATIESNVRSVNRIAQTARASGLEAAEVLRVMQIEINKFGGDVNNVDEMNDRIARTAALLMEARIPAGTFSDEATKVYDKMNTLSNDAEEARAATEAFMIILGQGLGDGEKAIEMIDELSEELGDRKFRGTLLKVNEALREQGQAMIEGFNFGTGRIENFERFVATLGNAEKAIIDLGEGAQRFTWDQIINPGEQAEAFESLRMLLEAGGEGYAEALGKISNATADANSRIFQFANSVEGQLQKRAGLIRAIGQNLGSILVSTESGLSNFANKLLGSFLDADTAFSLARENLETTRGVVNTLTPEIDMATAALREMAATSDPSEWDMSVLEGLEARLADIEVISPNVADQIEAILATSADELTLEKIGNLIEGIEDLGIASNDLLTMASLEEAEAAGERLNDILDDIGREYRQIGAVFVDPSEPGSEAASAMASFFTGHAGPGLGIDMDTLGDQADAYEEIIEKINDLSGEVGVFDSDIEKLEQFDAIMDALNEGMDLLRSKGQDQSDSYITMRNTMNALVAMQNSYNDSAVQQANIAIRNAALEAERLDTTLAQMDADQRRVLLNDMLTQLGLEDEGSQERLLELTLEIFGTKQDELHVEQQKQEALAEQEKFLQDILGDEYTMLGDVEANVDAQLDKLNAYIEQQSALLSVVKAEREALNIAKQRAEQTLIGGQIPEGVAVDAVPGSDDFAEGYSIPITDQESWNAAMQEVQDLDEIMEWRAGLYQEDIDRATEAVTKIQENQAQREADEERHQAAITRHRSGGISSRSRMEDKARRDQERREREAEREAERAERDRQRREQAALDAILDLDREAADARASIWLNRMSGIERSLEEEQRRYARQQQDLIAQHGQDSRVLQAAERLHQAKIAQIQADGRREQEEQIKAQAEAALEERIQTQEQITEFITGQIEARRMARLDDYEREAVELASHYADVKRMAEKAGMDVTAIQEQLSLDISALYGRRVTQVMTNLRDLVGLFPVHELSRQVRAMQDEFSALLVNEGIGQTIIALEAEKQAALTRQREMEDESTFDEWSAALTSRQMRFGDIRDQVATLLNSYEQTQGRRIRGLNPAGLDEVTAQIIEMITSRGVPLDERPTQAAVQQAFEAASERIDTLRADLSEKIDDFERQASDGATEQDLADLVKTSINAVLARFEAASEMDLEELPSEVRELMNQYVKANQDYADAAAQMMQPSQERDTAAAIVGNYIMTRDDMMAIVNEYVSAREAVDDITASHGTWLEELNHTKDEVERLNAEIDQLQNQQPAAMLQDAAMFVDHYLRKMDLVIRRHRDLEDRIRDLNRDYSGVSSEMQGSMDRLHRILDLRQDIVDEQIAARDALGLADEEWNQEAIMTGVQDAIARLDEALNAARDLLDQNELDEFLTNMAEQYNAVLLGQQQGTSMADAFERRIPSMSALFAEHTAHEINQPHSPTAGTVLGQHTSEAIQNQASETGMALSEGMMEDIEGRHASDTRREQQAGLIVESGTLGILERILNPEDFQALKDTLIEAGNRLGATVSDVLTEGAVAIGNALEKELADTAKRIDDRLADIGMQRDEATGVIRDIDRPIINEERRFAEEQQALAQLQTDIVANINDTTQLIAEAREEGNQVEAELLEEGLLKRQEQLQAANDQVGESQAAHDKTMKQLQLDRQAAEIAIIEGIVQQAHYIFKGTVNDLNAMVAAFDVGDGRNIRFREGMQALGSATSRIGGAISMVPGGQVAGAVTSLVGTGLGIIGELFGSNKELSDAEKLALEHERVNALLEQRQRTMQVLAGLAGEMLDDAREQAEFNAQSLRQLEGQVQGSEGMSPEEIMRRQEANTARLSELQQERANLNAEQEGEGLLEQAGELVAQIFGYEDETERMADIDAEIARLQIENQNLGSQVELRQLIRDAMIAELDARRSLNQVRQESGDLDSLEAAKDTYEAVTDFLELARAGTMRDASGRVIQFTEEELAGLEADATRALDAVREAERQAFVFERDRLRHEAEMSGEDGTDAVNAATEEQLAFERAILAEMEDQGDSVDRIREQKRRIWELEKAILTTTQQQTDENDKQLNQLGRLRNQILLAARQDGRIDATERDRLAGVEGQMAARMRSLGFADEDIARMMDAFRIQTFATGGWVEGRRGVGVPIIAGEAGAERVVSASEVARVGGRGALESFLANGYQHSVRHQAPIGGDAITVGGDTINLSGSSSDELWRGLEPRLDRYWDKKITEWEKRRGRYRG